MTLAEKFNETIDLINEAEGLEVPADLITSFRSKVNLTRGAPEKTANDVLNNIQYQVNVLLKSLE